MNESAPTVSVIVPCVNEKDSIERCLRSVLAQESPPGGFEVIVGDGMSNDGTREILSQLAQEDSRLRIVDNPARIVSTGLNEAIRCARGQIVMRMDAHTEYAPDYIRACVAVLEQTKADNVGGPARTQSTNYIQAAICAAYHSSFSVGGARFHDIDYEGYVDTIPYGCWPSEVFNWIGPFDEELVRNQDDEFNLRLLRAGGKIWQSPQIKSWYKPRGSLRSLFSQYMQYGYWKVRVIQKHKIPASMRHLVPCCFVFPVITLPIASFFWPPAAWAWLSIIGVYTIGNFAASCVVARRRWQLFPALPFVFASFHFAYGYGFLRGILDFLILHRGPPLRYTQLTRTPIAPRS